MPYFTTLSFRTLMHLFYLYHVDLAHLSLFLFSFCFLFFSAAILVGGNGRGGANRVGGADMPPLFHTPISLLFAIAACSNALTHSLAIISFLSVPFIFYI